MKTQMWTAALAALVPAMVLLSSPASAAITTPQVAGSMQGWNPDSPADDMTETAPGSGVWVKSYSGLDADSRHEFKITDGNGWDTNFPSANSWIFADSSGDLTITYDTNVYGDGWVPDTERLGVTVDPGAWTAVGSFQGAVGGSDWTNDDATTTMVSEGGGIYSFDAYPGAGDWEWKAVMTGTWDAIGGDGRTINAANVPFTLGEDEFARLSVNAFDGTVMTQVLPIPEPTSLAFLGLGGLTLLRRRR